MSKIIIKVHYGEVGKLLKGPEMQGVVGGIGARIAAAASVNGGAFGHDVVIGKSRAHGMVWTDDFDAMLAESKHRSLTRAIDAGRG